MRESQEGSNTSSSLIVGLAAAVILALGVGVLVYNRQPAPSTPPSSLPPTTTAGATSSPEAGPAPATVPPVEAPAQQPAPAAPPATSGGPQTAPGKAASSTGTGGSADAPRQPAKPTGRPSPAGPAAPQLLSAQTMLRRSFVPSRSVSESVKGISKSLAGFDARKSKDVTVKRAPDVDGRIQFSTTPARVKPGDKYTVRIALVNEGKRAIEIKELEVQTTINRKESSPSVKPLVKQVAARQNEVIHQISGTWDKSTTSFAVQVRVMSDRLDLYRNELVWK